MSSIKANPLRWLWDQARRVYERVRGERTEQVVEPIPTHRDRYLAQEMGKDIAGSLTDALAGGKISIQRWQLDFRQNLKDIYRNEYLLARGGRGAMTQSDWGKLGAMLKKQYGYMNRFAEEIAAGNLTDAQVKARMDMYFKSARQAYERGAESARGMPPLPAHPGDGSTVCLSNCQCHWDIQETDDEWLATWTLGAAEHCPDCVQRAGDWAPLRLPKL